MKKEIVRIWEDMDRNFLDGETIQKIKEIREGLMEYLSKLGLNVEVERLAFGIYRLKVGNEVSLDIEKFSKLRELLQQYGMYFDVSSSEHCTIVPRIFLSDIYFVGQDSYVTDEPWYEAHRVYAIIRYASFVELDEELLNMARESLSKYSSDKTWKPVIDAELVLEEKRKYVIKEVYVSIKDIPLCDD